MVERLLDARFEVREFDISGCHLYQKSQRPARSAVVFVHGWCGGAYSTWKDFPRFLLESNLDVDVALVNYVSGIKRWRRPQAQSLMQTSQQLNDTLRELSAEYESVYLIAHSLGVNVAKFAIKHFIESAHIDERTPLCPIAGIMCLGGASNGSRLMTAGKYVFRSESEWLSKGSDLLTHLETFLTNYVDMRAVVPVDTTRVLIPQFAMAANEDLVVNAASATRGARDGQVEHVSAGHLAVAKPTGPQAKQLAWAISNIREINRIRKTYRNTAGWSRGPVVHRTKPLGSVVAEFVAGQIGSGPGRAYDEARQEIAWTEAPVIDSREAPELEIDLLITVANASRLVVSQKDEWAPVVSASSRAVENPRLRVGMSPHGSQSADAAEAVDLWLRLSSVEDRFDVRPSEDEAALRPLLSEWFQLAIADERSRLSGGPDRRRRSIELNGDDFRSASLGGLS